MDDNDFGDFGSDPYEFANVIGDGDQPMYPGCRKKEYEDSTTCPTCGISRWKEGKDSILKEGVPAKVVWYFPPIPRFKRMFQSHETAKSLTWHATRKSIDGQLSHPADSPSWKLLDDKWPEFVLHMVEDGDRVCWKKKSIFFDLEYWKYLPVRHALDVMHIEKNVCDSIIGTLLEIPGKNKDGIAARLDLLNMGVKTDLQPEYGERRTRLPPGPWNLSRAEKREVCNSFYGMKVPEGYSSNIKNLVSLQDSRLLGLKSHDCHTLLQQLLPVAIRSVLEKPARYAITRLCFFFNAICAKTRYIAEEAVEFCTEHLSMLVQLECLQAKRWEFQSHYQVARHKMMCGQLKIVEFIYLHIPCKLLVPRIKTQFSQIWVSMVSFKKFGTLTTKSLQSQSLGVIG
ncbi:unnamed protein product [Prunus brigantina]